MCREELIDFNKYVISKDGTIVSKHWKREIKGWTDGDGYLVNCLLLNNGKRQPYRTNRVIAYLFCEKPKHLENIPYDELQVGHSDTNKKNNNANNLYWCTSKENMNNPITKEKRIGREPWNKGKTNCFTDETLKKMSEKSKNRHHTDETKIKQSEARRLWWVKKKEGI